MTVVEKINFGTFIAAHKRKRKKIVRSTIYQYLLVNVGPIERILSILDNDSHTHTKRMNNQATEQNNKKKQQLSKYSKTFQTVACTDSTLDQHDGESFSYVLLYSENAFRFLVLPDNNRIWWIALTLNSVRSFCFCF